MIDYEILRNLFDDLNLTEEDMQMALNRERTNLIDDYLFELDLSDLDFVVHSYFLRIKN